MNNRNHLDALRARLLRRTHAGLREPYCERARVVPLKFLFVMIGKKGLNPNGEERTRFWVLREIDFWKEAKEIK